MSTFYVMLWITAALSAEGPYIDYTSQHETTKYESAEQCETAILKQSRKYGGKIYQRSGQLHSRNTVHNGKQADHLVCIRIKTYE